MEAPDVTPAFVQSAYQHCARIAIGMLSSQGGLHPQLFFVGAPAQGDDASSSKIARVGQQAMAAFHATPEGADRLGPFIRQSLDPTSRESQALHGQLGRPVAAVHLCQAIAPAEVTITSPSGEAPATTIDGRRECLLVTVYTSSGHHVVWCPIHRDTNGQLRSQIVPLEL